MRGSAGRREGGGSGSGTAGSGGARSRGAAAGDGGTEAQAKDYCLRLLADRARSRAELAGKLDGRGFAPETARAALDRLTELGLVDDTAFAQQWVQSRHTHSGRGKRALAVELRRKGIDDDIAADALDAIEPEDERARATDLVTHKLRSTRIRDDAEREKVRRRLVGMLARRGFPSSMAYAVVAEHLPGVEEEFAGDLDGE
ncbi:recombination regulator RecX [Rhodococcus rhodnii]|nr:recombination regulator RecX [Rhodococcus rhodnii]